MFVMSYLIEGHLLFVLEFPDEYEKIPNLYLEDMSTFSFHTQEWDYILLPVNYK